MADPTPIRGPLLQLVEKAVAAPEHVPPPTVPREQSAAQDRIRTLAVPPEYSGRGLEALVTHGSAENRQHQQRMVAWGRAYVARFPDRAPYLLVLRGAPGTGKTHWLFAVATQLVATTRCRVIGCGDLVRHLRSAWTDRTVKEADVLRLWRSVPWLAIDDVDRHALRGEPVQELFELLNVRAVHHRHTVLSTNMQPKDLRDYLGLALADRIRGSGGLLECGTESFRPARAAHWSLDTPLTGETDGTAFR